MTLFPWNAMNYDDPSGSSACWLDPFHMIMSSKFPTTYYTTMRCDLCLVIAVCFRKDLFTFCLRCSTPTISHFHLSLSTKYFEFYFMIGESCLQVDTLWGNSCWMAGDSQKCILIYSACFRYILRSFSSFWEICWDPGMLCYNLHCLICSKKNCNEPIWHQCYPAVFVCLCRLFLTVNKCSPVWRKNVPARVGSHPETLPPVKIW